LSNNADICDHLHHSGHLKTGSRILHISRTLDKVAASLAANRSTHDGMGALKRKSFE
jgi:hypothetical protein